MTRDISGCSYLPGTHMTQRGPETLSRFYGFDSVDAAADSLPSGARVLDAGAGASRLGHTLAAMRPDVTWTNLDTDYAHTDAVALLKEDAPPNLTLQEGSIMDIHTLFSPGSFDRLFSYWAINYIDDAETAVQRLIEAARPAGKVALGKLWVLRDGVATPSTITFPPSSITGRLKTSIAQGFRAFQGATPPLAGVEYAPVRGDDSVK